MPLSSDPYDLSLVCPAFNEADNLSQLLDEWSDALRSIGRPFEMIVVDDGSTDETAELLQAALRSDPALRVLRMQHRSGQSAALAAGFEVARGRWIVTSDADLQNDPADLPRMLELASEFDFVCGWRKHRQDRLTKRLTARIANALRRRLLDDGLHDAGCGLKVFRREVADRIPRFDGMHRFLPALASIEGFSVTELIVRHRPRTRGRSKYSIFNRFRRPIEDLLAVAWYRARRLNYRVEELAEQNPDGVLATSNRSREESDALAAEVRQAS